MERKYSETDSDHYKILQQLRRNMEDVLKPRHTDDYLQPFLRARNYDLGKAEKMIRLVLSMRELYQMDNLEDYKAPEVTEKYEFVSLIGFDKEGSPVRYLSLRDSDIPGFMMAMSTIELGRYCEHIVEYDRRALEEENRKTGRNAKGYNFIFDMNGFSVQQLIVKPVLETGLDLIKIFQDFHPEDIKSVYFVNAPVVFYAAFNLFKPVLRLGLLERIYVYSKDSVPDKLLEAIDHEILPQSIGGSRVDPNGDPMYPSVIKHGGKVPQHLYRMNQEYLQENQPGAKTFVIPARSFYEVAAVVEKSGTRIRMEFRSEHYSVGLRLLYKHLPYGMMQADDLDHLQIQNIGDGEATLISSPARIQSHLAPVDEMFHCWCPGIYIFHFDNTFSLIHSKRVIYRTEIFPPAE